MKNVLKFTRTFFYMQSFGGNGGLVCSIDNMPTQLPRESTEFFGTLLMPHLEQMVKLDAKQEFSKQIINPIVKDVNHH
jgi:alpha-aminoadipic semialdehyde synthase